MSSAPAERIERIRDKLRTVAVMPGRSRSFGEEKHRFELYPPLTETQIRAAEERYGIRLPEGYRRFLLCLGEGGAGPAYGLSRLEDALRFDPEDGDDYLRRSCPLEADPAETAGATADSLQGTLEIGTHGCAFDTLLVVSGRMRGRVVEVNRDFDDPPYFPEDADFLAWYERWLDEMVRGYHLTWFGYRLPGGEAELQAVFTAPDEPSARRARAIRSLVKLPILSPTASGSLSALLSTADSAAVRCIAAELLGHFRILEAAAVLIAGTADPEATVREASLGALARLGGDDGKAAAQRLLSDPDPKVQSRALRLLHAAGDLQIERLLPLLQDADWRVRKNAVYFLGELIRGGAGRETAVEERRLLDAVLEDPDYEVRRSARLALREFRTV